MAFRWRASDDLILNVGLVALLFFRGFAKNCYETLYFMIFQGVGVRTHCPPLDPRMDQNLRWMNVLVMSWVGSFVFHRDLDSDIYK